MSEEKWNPSQSSEDFSLEDILLEFSTSYGKSPDAPEEASSAPGSTPVTLSGGGRPTAEADTRWKDLLQELTLPASLQTNPTISAAPTDSLPELIVVPAVEHSAVETAAQDTVAAPDEKDPVDDSNQESVITTFEETGSDTGVAAGATKQETDSFNEEISAADSMNQPAGEGEQDPPHQEPSAENERDSATGETNAENEQPSADSETADGETAVQGDQPLADSETPADAGQAPVGGEAVAQAGQPLSDSETPAGAGQAPDSGETASQEDQPLADSKTPAGEEQATPDGEAADEGEPVAAGSEAPPEEGQEAAGEETPPEGEQEPAQKTRRRSQPTADVPFQSDRVLVFLSSAVEWFRHRGKKPAKQKERVPRPKERPAPDTPPKELASQYGKGLGKLRTRSICVLLMGILLLYPTLVVGFDVPAPPVFQDFKVILGVSAGLFLLALFWSRKFLWETLLDVMNRQFDMPLLSLLAVLWTIADGISMFVGFRPQGLPLFAPVTFVLGVQMLGRYWDLLCKRISCRTAALAAEPYAVTLDYDQWEGEPSFRKHAVMECPGFGSQIQSRDGAQKRFARVVPVLLIICLALSLISTVAHHQPKLVFWGLSAYFTAASALTGCLCFSLPSLAITRRLSGLGAALAGWDGMEDAQDSDTVLLEDGDFFPPGTIKLQTFQTFEEFAPERVISVAATLIRASGSGLDSLFHNLVRAEDGQYLNLSNFTQFPSGMTGTISDQEVFVGNAQFMEEMGVEVPDGFRVRNAVFCSLNLRLAGLFMLEYNLHRSIPLGVDALLTSKLTPVLLGRDFNLIPSMLRQKFKLPWDKMVFASPTQRDNIPPEPSHQVLTAILCREGMEPYATAVAGAQRLAFATRLNSLFACLGSVVGIILTFFLVSAGAVNALSGVSLTLFLFLWLIPVALLSGWVNQF